MTPPEADPAAPRQLEVGSEVDFFYQKSPQYRTVHVDGFYGGNTARGYMNVTFYTERPPVPKQTRRTIIASDGKQFTAGPETVVDALAGTLRLLETTAFMDLNTAREFYAWFGEHLAVLEDAAGVPQDQRLGRKSEA